MPSAFATSEVIPLMPRCLSSSLILSFGSIWLESGYQEPIQQDFDAVCVCACVCMCVCCEFGRSLKGTITKKVKSAMESSFKQIIAELHEYLKE